MAKSNKDRENKNRTAREWLQARNVIINFIRVLCPRMEQDHLEHNAGALIAQLANHDPPLIIVPFEWVKEKM